MALTVEPWRMGLQVSICSHEKLVWRTSPVMPALLATLGHLDPREKLLLPKIGLTMLNSPDRSRRRIFAARSEPALSGAPWLNVRSSRQATNRPTF